MPTLSGIQGGSLQPRVDVVETIREGAKAGEDIRRIKQRADIDEAIAAAAASPGGAPAGTANTPAGVATGTPAGAPAGTGRPPPALRTAQETGQVDPNRPTFNPIKDLNVAQQQLMQYGEQGMAAAAKLGELQDLARTRANQAAKREAEQMGQLATSLLTLGYEDRQSQLKRLQADFGNDPTMLKFTERLLNAKNPTESDFMLHRAVTRATGVADQLNRQQEGRELNIRQQEADTAATNALTNLAKVQQTSRSQDLTERRLEQDIREYEALPAEEQRAVADQAVKPVLDKATAAINIGSQTLAQMDRVESLIDGIEAAEGGVVTVGLQERLASAAGAIDPALGEEVRTRLEVGQAADMAALNTIMAQALATQIAEMSKAGFSNADLEAQARTLPNMRVNSTAEMRRVVNEVRDNINQSTRFALDVIDTSVKPASEGGGSMATLRKVSDNAKDQRQISNSRRYPDAPAIGTVQDGYEYVGGNPGARGNWRKVTP